MDTWDYILPEVLSKLPRAYESQFHSSTSKWNVELHKILQHLAWRNCDTSSVDGSEIRLTTWDV